MNLSHVAFNTRIFVLGLISKFLHESLLKIWDFFHECEKRRRISHKSGRNSRSSIETSVRTYFFRFEQCLHFSPETG